MRHSWLDYDYIQYDWDYGLNLRRTRRRPIKAGALLILIAVLLHLFGIIEVFAW